MKSSDLDLVLSAWPAARPTAGFADRVMVACAAPPVNVRRVPAARPRRSRSLLAVAALVAASVLVPLLLQRSAPPQALASIPVVADLGPLQD
jgi:hypothetical protein